MKTSPRVDAFRAVIEAARPPGSDKAADVSTQMLKDALGRLGNVTADEFEAVKETLSSLPGLAGGPSAFSRRWLYRNDPANRGLSPVGKFKLEWQEAQRPDSAGGERVLRDEFLTATRVLPEVVKGADYEQVKAIIQKDVVEYRYADESDLSPNAKRGIREARRQGEDWIARHDPSFVGRLATGLDFQDSLWKDAGVTGPPPWSVTVDMLELGVPADDGTLTQPQRDRVEAMTLQYFVDWAGKPLEGASTAVRPTEISLETLLGLVPAEDRAAVDAAIKPILNAGGKAYLSVATLIDPAGKQPDEANTAVVITRPPDTRPLLFEIDASEGNKQLQDAVRAFIDRNATQAK